MTECGHDRCHTFPKNSAPRKSQAASRFRGATLVEALEHLSRDSREELFTFVPYLPYKADEFKLAPPTLSRIQYSLLTVLLSARSCTILPRGSTRSGLTHATSGCLPKLDDFSRRSSAGTCSHERGVLSLFLFEKPPEVIRSRARLLYFSYSTASEVGSFWRTRESLSLLLRESVGLGRKMTDAVRFICVGRDQPLRNLENPVRTPSISYEIAPIS